MTPIIEKTSSDKNPAVSALVIALLILVIVGAGDTFAYMNGYFPGHSTAIEYTIPVLPAP